MSQLSERSAGERDSHGPTALKAYRPRGKSAWQRTPDASAPSTSDAYVEGVVSPISALVNLGNGVLRHALRLDMKSNDIFPSVTFKKSSSTKRSMWRHQLEENCTDEKHPVPEPPNLQAINEKKKGDALEQDEYEKRVIARVQRMSWTQEVLPGDKPVKRTSFRASLRGSVPEDPYPTGQLRRDARKRPLPGAHPEFPYECLAFKGGGAKGSIYPGAIRALEEVGVMPHIKRFSGASAGALIAALLAAGLTADQLFIELATTDLQPLVLDSSTAFHKAQGVVNRFGMHPGNGLYQHIGLLFFKYLGSADVTFQQLYDYFGVELAIAVTNISRASVELLHVKTAPNYPIRKAVRASMSLPVALHPCKDRNIHSVVSEEVHNLHREMEALGTYRMVQEQPGGDQPVGDADASQAPTEYYVDGGVLNNYPIDCFDGWWLSMDRDDAFFRKVIGVGGHKNYVERFGSYDEKTGARKVNPKTMGFRLASEDEPDAMHSRLGNDALELKVRRCKAAQLPETKLGDQYAERRFQLNKQADERLKQTKELRSAMTWIKEVRDEEWARSYEERAELAKLPLAERLTQRPPPPELLEMLGITEKHLEQDVEEHRFLAELLRHHHYYHGHGTKEDQVKMVTNRGDLDDVLKEGGWPRVMVESLYKSEFVSDKAKLSTIQSIVRGAISGKMPTLLEACDELEELLEANGEEIMKRLTGMQPKEVTSIGAFVARMIEAIQMTNDERVQTKENYSRTCMLNTEYVNTMDFKLDEGDHYFLWRKGYLSTIMWLDKRTAKSKEKKKKVAKGVAKALISEAKAKAPSKDAKDAPDTPGPSAADSSKPAVSDLHAKLLKTLDSATLLPEEKVDIMRRHLEREAGGPPPPKSPWRRVSRADSNWRNSRDSNRDSWMEISEQEASLREVSLREASAGASSRSLGEHGSMSSVTSDMS